MKKTISVTLNNIAYTLSEDAYKLLREYLDGVKNYFEKTDSKETVVEIISDIEASVAEKFSAKLNASKQVISLNDVEALIKVMGSIEDIADETDSVDIGEPETKKEEIKKETGRQETKITKKLYRDTDDVVIAGVCSGIAKYFEIDPVFVRLFFVATVFFGGLGVLLYLVLWLVMPAAKTNVQKLEMKGDALTLKKIEEIVKEKSAEIRESAKNGDTQKILEKPTAFIGEIFSAIGNLFKNIIPIISKLIGFFVIFCALLGVAIVSFFAAVMLFSRDTVLLNTDLPLQNMFSYPEYMSLVVSGYLSIILPIFFVLLIGVGFMKVKSIFSMGTTITFIGIWIISCITFGVILVDVSPRIKEAVKIQDEVERVARDLDMKDFDSLYLNGTHNVKIEKGDIFDIRIEGREQDLNRLDIKVENSELKIRNREMNGMCFLCYLRDVDVLVTMPELRFLNIRGAGDVKAIGFSSNDFEIDMSGASKANLDIDTKKIIVNLRGVSKLDLKGTSTSVTANINNLSYFKVDDLNTDSINIEVDGSSKVYLSGVTKELVLNADDLARVYALPLLAEKARVNTSQSSKVEVNVSELLDASGDDYSQITYRGEAVVKNDMSEGGELEQIFSFEEKKDNIADESDKDDLDEIEELVDIEELK